MQKTVKEWLEECTEPWAAKAIKYLEEDKRALIVIASSLSAALRVGFNWWQTDEGYTFWYNIHFDLEQKENNEKDV